MNLRSVVLAAGLMAPLSATAQGPAWQFQASRNVNAGEPATITLGVENDVHEVELVLTPVSGSGQPTTFKAKKLTPGKPQLFRFPVPAGRSKWKGRLTGSAGGETTTAELDIEVVSAGPLDVQLMKADVDLERGRVMLRPSHALERVEVRATDASGQLVFDDEATLSGGEGGRVAVSFPVPPGTNLRIAELRAYDAADQWVGVRIVRWYEEVQHDNVEFESAKWDVRPSEVPKLEKAVRALEQAIETFRRDLGDEAATVDVAVYVAGYTDTVGSPADNRVLSQHRAEAIARWFRAHGVTLPVHYQGFGEAGQAVETSDEVDEARNRRALYILASAAPAGAAFPGARWERLK